MSSATKHAMAIAGILSACLLADLCLAPSAAAQNKSPLGWRDDVEPDGTCVTRRQLAQAEVEAPKKAAPAAETQTQPSPADEKSSEKKADPGDKPELPDVPIEQPSSRGKREPLGPDEKSVKPAGTPQDLLLSFGVDRSYYEMLVDGQEIDAAEDEAMLKFMYAVRRFRTLHIHKWISPHADLRKFVDHTDDHRGDIVRLEGRVTNVSIVRPLPEQVVRFELSHFYRCDFQLAVPAESKDAKGEKGVEANPTPAPKLALIYTPTVPKAWVAPQAVMPEGGWRASVEGFFLKVGAEGRLVFVTQRIAWHPPGLLGDLGMDMGMFDDVSPGPLGTSDREAFYQMLDALGRVGTQELSRRTQIKPGATTFGPSHVRDWRELTRAMLAEDRAVDASGGQEIYKRLAAPLRKKLEELPPGATPSEELQAECYASFNIVMADPELFDARAWQGERIAMEADTLLHKAMARMPTAELQTLNRRLLETAFAAELAPGSGTALAPEQVQDASGLAHRIRLEARYPTPKPGKRLYAGFSAGLQNAIRDLPEGVAPDKALEARLLAAINQLLKNPNLYDSVAWSAFPLPEDAAESLEKVVATLSPQEVLRFNRLLFEAAFPEMIAQSHPYSVVPLFTQPDRQLGRLVALEGTCRRALRVPVDDPDIRTRFKIDHYFEIQVFTADSQSNPVTFCVRSLPPGMPEGERISVKVRVSGFFFKTWSYVIPLTAERKKEILKKLPSDKRATFKGEDERMYAPLLIARQPVWLRDPPPVTSSIAGYVAGGLFVAALIVAWVAIWITNRGDRRFTEATLSKQYELEPGANLNKAGIEESPEVDFTNYDPAVATAEAEAAEQAGGPVPSRVGKRYYVKRSRPMTLLGGGFSRKLFGSDSSDAPEETRRRSGDNIFQGVVGDEKTRGSAVKSVAVFIIPMFLVIGLYMILRLFSQHAPGSATNPPPVRSAPAAPVQAQP